MDDRDARIADEFAAGAEVPDIAARYAVPTAYVDRVIEEAVHRKPQGRDWSLKPLGNRVLYSVLIALAVNVASSSWHGWIVGAALLLISSAIVAAGRNR
jgi:hypothetical protein